MARWGGKEKGPPVSRGPDLVTRLATLAFVPRFEVREKA
jgi:hypothetical protein